MVRRSVNLMVRRSIKLPQLFLSQFNLYCEKNILVEICITVSSAALAVTQGVANKFTDMYGRKRMVGCCLRLCLIRKPSVFRTAVCNFTWHIQISSIL